MTSFTYVIVPRDVTVIPIIETHDELDDDRDDVTEVVTSHVGYKSAKRNHQGCK